MIMKIKEQTPKEHKKITSDGTRLAVISFFIMIAVIVLLFIAYFFIAHMIEDSFDERSPEEIKAEMEAEKNFFPKLDKLYSSGDYEGFAQLIFSNEADNIDVCNYEHYDLADFYRQYLKVKNNYVLMLDGGSINGIDARELTASVFSYYYRCYDHTMGVTGHSTEADIKILDDIREKYMLKILYDRMGYTIEDMEAARPDIMKDNFFHADIAHKYSDKYYERYR